MLMMPNFFPSNSKVLSQCLVSRKDWMKANKLKPCTVGKLEILLVNQKTDEGIRM